MNDKYESWELGKNLQMSDSFAESKSIFKDKEFWRSLYPEEFGDTEIEEGINYKNYEMIEGERIEIATDSTDHFQFICKNCKKPMKTMDILTCLTENIPTLKFYCFCIYCRKSGMRKIYLNDDDCIGQRVLINNDIYFWNGKEFVKKD